MKLYVINEDDKKNSHIYNSLKQCCAFSNFSRLRSDLIIIFKKQDYGNKVRYDF